MSQKHKASKQSSNSVKAGGKLSGKSTVAASRSCSRV